MKNTVYTILILFICTSFSFAEEGPRIIPMNYTIVSVEKDKSLKNDEYRLKGQTKMFSSDFPLDNVLIGSTQSGTWIHSDSSGMFDQVFKTDDQNLYFYKDGWSEIQLSEPGFKGGHVTTVEVWLYQQTNNVKRKPVIYLYNDEVLSCTVQINPFGQFTFTYPEYNDGWEVVVKPDVGLSVEGKVYPYLFWEASSPGLFYDVNQGTMEGFFIATDTAVDFLDHQLSLLGLNSTEKTDFITYWGPELQKEPYALIQFSVDEDYQKDIAALKITPHPESSRRVFMLYSGLSEPNPGVELVTPSWSSFERKRFTLVEWGGTEIDLNVIKP